MHISRIPISPRRAVRLPALLFAALLCAFALPACAQAQPTGHDHHAPQPRKQTPKAKNHHPDARPGVTGSKVLSGEVVPSRAREPYTIAARIPQVLDALYCHCDCHERDDKRSLLECFEDDMASTCGICQGQARMAGELHAQGKTLAEIRAAVDQRYGG